MSYRYGGCRTRYDHRTLEKYRAQANRMLALLSGNVSAALRGEAEEKSMEEGLTAINRLMLLRQARQVEEAKVAARREAAEQYAAQRIASNEVEAVEEMALMLPPASMPQNWGIGASLPTGDR